MNKNGIKRLSEREVTHAIKSCDSPHKGKFTFLLGSGSSVSSGIPTGGMLAKKWYKELLTQVDEERLKDWQKQYEGIEDEEKQAEFYSAIYDKRFGHIPKSGYEELKSHMEGKDPFLGYFILAKIITETHNNIVITTNFDNLIEDAVRFYTKKSPLVIGHEQLALYATSHSDRPIIIKLHRDLLLETVARHFAAFRLETSYISLIITIFNM